MTITDVAALECALVDGAWDFAEHQAEAIDRHWADRTARTPEMFNGRVLVLKEGAIGAPEDRAAIFSGSCMEVEFKAFLAWREFGYPGDSVRNIFSMAALETADGAFVLGEMAPHTAPAGQVYFPAGTPDRKDVFGTVVDIEGSAERELKEETGLGRPDITFMPGLTLVMDKARVCAMKRVVSPDPADVLVDRIHAFLACDPKPELARMHIVRGPDEITPRMPGFVAAYLTHRFAAR